MRKIRRRSRSRSRSRVRRSIRRSIRRSRNRTVKGVKKRTGRQVKSYNEYLDYFTSPKKGRKCVDMSHLKKYAKRPGPSYSAQDCKDEIKNGNDGLMYMSIPNRKGVYRWQKL
jgi:hypothetical protein